MNTRATRLTFAGLVGLSAGLGGCAASDGAERAAAGRDEIRRERIEWCDIWVTDADREKLPRVLLVGDSITRGYFNGVEERLAGKACCARVTTSKSIGDPGLLPEVELLLDQYRFDVIHVNNGLHGWGYTEEQYARAFGPFMSAITEKAAGARIIWAQTTPVIDKGSTDNERTNRVKARNRIAAEFAAARSLPVDDLFSLVVGHPEWYSPDGVHFNGKGIDAQSRQVADCILSALGSGEAAGGTADTGQTAAK